MGGTGTKKKFGGTLWDDGNLYLDRGSSYLEVYICQNSLNGTLIDLHISQQVNFACRELVHKECTLVNAMQSEILRAKVNWCL